MRIIDADELRERYSGDEFYSAAHIREAIDGSPTASPWHRVEDGLPKEAGEYIVAYHPCHWDNVVTKVTKVGIDNFRGKSAWAKKKFQRVTHWMEKPEPPKEDA
jgi:hypothetical protein